MKEPKTGYKVYVFIAVIGVMGILQTTAISNGEKLSPALSRVEQPAEPQLQTRKAQLMQPDLLLMQQSKTLFVPFMAAESGWVTKDGQVGTGLEHPPQAGDWNNNMPVRGFLSFDLTKMPKGLVLNTAELDLQGAGPQGDVFPSFGVLTFEAVWYGLSLGPSAYVSPAYSLIRATYEPPASKLGVTDAVSTALSAGRSRFQVRFRFALETNGNNQGEIYWVPVHFAEPKLRITYRSQ